MADVTKEIALKVVATDATGPALESLEDKLNAAKKRMVELAAAGKQNTEEFQRLQVEAGGYKRTIEGVEQSVDSFAKGGSRALTLMVEASQAVAAGFAIAQGAAALFGDENEDLQKAMIQVQGAMALVNGVQQISILLTQKSVITTQAAAAAQKVYAVAVGTSTGAMKAFRIALLATGIGAAVAAIGLLIAKWDELTAAVRRYLNLPDPKQRAMEEGLALARQETQLENYRDAYEKHTNDLIEADKKRKETQKELFEIQKKYRNDLLLLNAEGLRKEIIAIDQKYAADLDKLKKHGKDTATLEAVIAKEKSEKEKEFGIQLIDVQQVAADRQKEAADKQEQDNIAIMQRNAARRKTDLETEIAIAEKKKAIDKEVAEQRAENIKQVMVGLNALADLAKASSAAEVERADRAKEDEILALDRQLKDKLITQEFYEQQKAAITDKYDKEAEKYERKQFELNKAAGIANAMVNTYLAATQVLATTKGGTVARFVAMAATITAGLAQVAVISKQQFRGRTAGKMSATEAISGGGGSSTATPSPTFSNPNTTMLGTDGAALNANQANQPMRAYVVERDIQQTTSRVRRLSEFATLG